MSIGIITVLLFGLVLALLAIGFPVAFSIGGVAILFLLWQLGPNSLIMISATAWEAWTNYTLITIPLFVLMAYFLQESGMADDLYEAMYRWMGGLRGGLAMGTIVICTVFAAMAGTSAVGTLTMGLAALPSMQKRGYDKQLSMGSVSAGGTLGILIPPSMPMIVYAFLAQESVGAMFMAGILPGIMLSLLFIAYIAIRSVIQPQLAPAVPKDERYTLRQKIASSKSMLLPLILIFMVLGFIYLGVTTPTEAAAIGAFGAFITTVIYKRFSLKLLKNSLIGMLRVTAMAGWIIVGALLFKHVYSSLGASELVSSLIFGLGLNKYLIIGVMQLILLFLGCFLDPIGIMMITIPIFLPVVKALGFDPVWFGILFTINLEMACITPPVGINLFYLQILAPKGTTMGEIYKSIAPYILIITIGLVIVMFFPEIALWLPSNLIKGR